MKGSEFCHSVEIKGSECCHSVENQNKIFRLRTFSRDPFLETKMFEL